jgi:hypothetical protein
MHITLPVLPQPILLSLIPLRIAPRGTMSQRLPHQLLSAIQQPMLPLQSPMSHMPQFNLLLYLNASTPLNVYFPSQLTCRPASNCPNGYYLDSSYGWLQCVSCLPPCITCNNSTICLSCTFGIIYKGTYKSSCTSGYFLNATTPAPLPTLLP